MDYITAKQAALKWGLGVRQVQNYCNNGGIKGAIRFSGVWAIPGSAPKPAGSREGRIVDSEAFGIMNDMPDVFKKIVDLFPYRLNISDTNGYLVYGNDSFFEGTLPKVRGSAIGHYNILQEPLLEKWGLTEHIRRAFQGECVYTPGLRFPNKDLLGSKYGIDHAFFTLYNDVNSFPIFSDDGRLQYIVTAFIPVRQYSASDEVMRAIEYIEKKWTESLCTRQVAQTAHLSVTSFVQRFRNETGLTPHEYYSQYRMMKLRDMLQNSGLAIAQAFDACGMDYNSYYTKLFKRYFGLTPTEFRKQNQ